MPAANAKKEIPVRQHNETAMYCLRLLLAILVTAVIHVPFALMKGKPAPARQDLDFGETTQAVSLPPPAPNLPDAIQAIYNWTEINDPTLLILPNYKLGFNHFIPKSPELPRQPVPPIEDRREDIPMPPPLSVPLGIDSVSLASLIYESWNRTTEITLPHAQPSIPVHGVFWRSENGQMLSNPPKIDEARQNLAFAQGAPTQTTALEIAPVSLLPIPRIIIRRSCGNAQLDMVAVDAVRCALAQAGPLPLTPGAIPGMSLFLIIDWHL